MCATLSVSIVIIHLICLQFYTQSLYQSMHNVLKLDIFRNQVSHVPLLLFFGINSLKSVLLQV